MSKERKKSKDAHNNNKSGSLPIQARVRLVTTFIDHWLSSFFLRIWLQLIIIIFSLTRILEALKIVTLESDSEDLVCTNAFVIE